MIREYVVKITDDVIPDGFARFEDEYSPEIELVRCKDCRWWHESEIHKGFGVCGQANGIAFKLSDWFCADGERRGKDDG